jgi:HEXXH motif-containing protein
VLSSHRTPVGDLDEVATGRLTAGSVARIASVERSRRLLMFRAIAAAEPEAAADGSPLPPVAEAFDVLAQAERFCPEAVLAILSHPPVGVWTVSALRHLRDGGTASREPPLWHLLGYAHALAGAAALRSGLPGVLRVPATAGTVTLPTVGQAVFPGKPAGYDVALLHVTGRETATLSLGGQCLSIRAGHGRSPARTAPSPAVWLPPRRLAGSAGSAPGPDLLLEDTDPYRDFRSPPTACAPLTDDEADRWRQLLRVASDILFLRHPHAARMVSLMLRAVVPLPAMPRFRTASASYSEAVGSALISLPQDGVDLAVTLVHEARHSALNGLDHQVRLVEPPAPGQQEALFYAPWRMDARPLWGILHGSYAFTGVAEFWRTERTALSGPAAGLAHFEYAVLRDALTEVLTALPTRHGITEWGRRFVGHLVKQIAPWRHDHVPDEPLSLARTELADLRATWRMRHLCPQPSACVRLADRWLDGAPAEEGTAPRSAMRDAPLFRWSEPRGELRRVLLAEGPSAVRGAPGSGAPPVPYDREPALLAVDRLLLSGEAADARHAYGKVLAEDPDRPAAWVGLGLALDAAGQHPAARALLRRPEVVRAVALTIRARTGCAPDPEGLARWLGRVPGLCASDGHG